MNYLQECNKTPNIFLSVYIQALLCGNHNTLEMVQTDLLCYLFTYVWTVLSLSLSVMYDVTKL